MKNVFSIVRRINDAGYKAKATIIEKNGVNKTGIEVFVNDNSGLIFYPNEYWMDEDEFVNHIIKTLKKDGDTVDKLKELVNTGIDNLKDKLFICLQPYVENPNYITFPYLDMQIYIRLFINDEMSTKVTESFVELWGINEDALFRMARENTKKSISIKPIGMALTDLGMGIEDLEDSHIIYPIVFTTNKYMYGASSMLITEELDRLAERIDSDLYILPSSIHECLLIPEDIVEDVTSLKQMVLEANEQEVSKEEFLSNSVYKYMREPYKVYIAM